MQRIALFNNILTRVVRKRRELMCFLLLILLLPFWASLYGEGQAKASIKKQGIARKPDLKHASEGSRTGRQKLQGNVLHDSDYQFSLRRPGPDWILLPEHRVRRLNADSVAGLYGPADGTFSVVIVERAPGVSLEAYARFYPGTLKLREKKIAMARELETANGPAYRLRVSGILGARHIAYFITIFKREDVFYLLISWRAAGTPLSPRLVQVHGDFRLLRSGPVVFPSVIRSRPATGIGWRIKGDVYDNPVHGVRCRLPRGRWRFMNRTELQRLNMDASMGMQHSSGVYVVLIGEIMGGVAQADYERLIRGNFERGNRFRAHRQLPAKFLQQDLQGHLYENVSSSRVLFDYHMLIMKRGHVGLQVITWWHSGNRANAMARLGEIHAGFEVLEPEARSRLRGALLDGAGKFRSVARHESFRNFTYRNFKLGLALRLPRGYWLHRLGPEARKQERDITLALENLERGLYLTLAHEARDENVSDTDFHAGVLRNLEPYRHAKTKIVKSGGLVIHSTRFHSGKAPEEYTYRLLSMTAGKKRLKILLYGAAGSMQATGSLEQEIIKGIDLTGTSVLDVVQRKDGGLEDRRLGFRVLRPDFTWSVKDILAGERKNRASMFFLRNPFSDADAVFGAMYVTANVRRLILQRLLLMPGLQQLKLKRTREADVEWYGHPARLTVFRGRKAGQVQQVRFLTAYIGGILYLSLIRSKAGDPAGRQMADSFQLME